LQLVGGIGLFLLGMILMTDGIKAFAGDALRQALMRFAGRPLRAFVSGMLVTMIVQSSSATTVTVIGFVSAGLLTFSQAVCVVIGASLGTTGTSWLVSVLGLRFSLGYYALPLLAVGTLVRLLARSDFRHTGLALAGFALILMGIQTLQDGMVGFSSSFNIAARPRGNLLDHLLLMLTGAALTVITQSSSAAMATILTALHTDSIHFEQAASLVIGAAIGTTITSVLAAIGASIPARRTALSHVVFNLVTGLIAIVMLPLFLHGLAFGQRYLGIPPGAISLAVFHTAFISLGVLLFLPFVGPFSRWIERLLPETGPRLTRHLDDSVLNVPEVALEAARRALCETATSLFEVVRARLSQQSRELRHVELPRIHDALQQIQHFVARIPPLPEDRPMSLSRVDQMHAMDHLLRLEASLHPPRKVWETLSDPHIEGAVKQTSDLLRLADAGLRGQAPDDWSQQVGELAAHLAELRRGQRPVVLQQTAHGEWDPNRALNLLDTMRWLDRLGYHTWRICHYLAGEDAEEERPFAEQ
jgi:phosphate:Na+ symporter